MYYKLIEINKVNKNNCLAVNIFNKIIYKTKLLTKFNKELKFNIKENILNSSNSNNNCLNTRNVIKPIKINNFYKSTSFNISNKIKIKQITLEEPSPTDTYPVESIRNIGIIAHIDAGKTTTTERMLLYSGVIQHAGEVHDGTTFTDYMDQERQRGITIRAAAVSFKWKNNQINLIDTPGHIDFSAEVERSLRVMDSAVIIFDASMGVETQTVTVWKQGFTKYNLPVIAYINKIDKMGSSISNCLSEMYRKLEKCNPVLVNYPIGEDVSFKGIVDLISFRYLEYSGVNGEKVEDKDILESNECNRHLLKILKSRNSLIEELCNYSEELMNIYLEEQEELNNLDIVQDQDIHEINKLYSIVKSSKIKKDLVIKVLKEATINQSIVPTLCGSSLKNKGVQQLLDFIVDILPSPLESNPIKISEVEFGERNNNNNDNNINNYRKIKQVDTKDNLNLQNNKEQNYLENNHNISETINFINDGIILLDKKTCNIKNHTNIINVSNENTPIGFIYKIINDPRLGSLSYFKLYHGTLKKNSTIKFVSKNKLYNQKVEKITQILRVKGDECLQLNEIKAGDIGALVGLKSSESGLTFTDNKSNNNYYINPIDIPDPVFFCSIYSRSNANSKELKRILKMLQIEDPSLRLKDDNETGQTVISGLGELHLEIIRDRIEIEYGIKAVLGKLRVSFRESVRGYGSSGEHLIEKVLNKDSHYMKIEIEVMSLDVNYKPHYYKQINTESKINNYNKKPKFISNFENTAYYFAESNCEIITDYEQEEKTSRIGSVLFKGEEEVFKSINQLNYNNKQSILNYLEDSLSIGVLAGYPLMNIKINIKNGEYSNKRTNDASMKICISEALKNAINNADPGLLEPFMYVETICSSEYSNSIINEISKRKGILESVVQEAIDKDNKIRFNYKYLMDNDCDDRKKNDLMIQTIIKSYVALTEMIGYSAFIRSATKGEATYYMNFSNYNFASYELQQKVLSGDYFYDV